MEGLLGMLDHRRLARSALNEMVVEDGGTDDSDDDPGGHPAHENNHCRGCKQPCSQPRQPSHSPVPIRYPTPRTVLMKMGYAGSSPSLRRRWPT